MSKITIRRRVYVKLNDHFWQARDKIIRKVFADDLQAQWEAGFEYGADTALSNNLEPHNYDVHGNMINRPHNQIVRVIEIDPGMKRV